jgi:hypothetical protein
MQFGGQTAINFCLQIDTPVLAAMRNADGYLPLQK